MYFQEKDIRKDIMKRKNIAGLIILRVILSSVLFDFIALIFPLCIKLLLGRVYTFT